ncbi:MAG: hypothetical protein K9L88_08020 [Chromatiaceae bacterium]|nr:hypothetical protein [Chromatiaceae bacterium]
MALRLIDDPRWKVYVQRYAFSLRRFTTEVVGMTPTHQQLELLDSVSPPGSRTSVRSGHGSGKSRSIAVMVLWHLTCYPKSNTLLTAPKIEQVKNISWKEASDVLDLMRTKGGHPWIVDYIVLEAERIYIKGFKQTWFVFAKTAPRGNPENLAGMHRDWYLVIADEASGIPDPNYSVLTGALTDARNRMVLLSQPTRPSGFFYETHNALAEHNGGVWNAIRMDSTDSPLVSSDFIDEKKLEYTEEEYTIKVLGEFPEQRDDYLLGRKAAEACMGRSVIKDSEPYGLLLSCDVGAGEYRDKSVALVAKVTGAGDFGPDARRVEVTAVPVLSNTRNLQSFTGTVFQEAAELENVTVLVDAGGMGVAVCQGLEGMGLPDVTRIKWGLPCFMKRNRERFANQRAQAMVHASRAAKEGRLGIADGPWKRELLDQMSRVPFSFDERARYVIAKKADMQRQGLPSPDLWDAISFCFIEGVTFNLCEGGPSATNAGLSAVEEAEALFADVA